MSPPLHATEMSFSVSHHRPDVQDVHERLWELLPLPGLTCASDRLDLTPQIPLSALSLQLVVAGM
jgi:hypothetical protein